jgi:hypothetical protein
MPLPAIYPPLEPHDSSYMRNPTGMALAEAAVWHAFRRTNAGRITQLYYNVHVGTVPGDDPNASDADRRLRAQLYAKRVDVIALAPPETWVIEVKPRANPSALGQLLVYVPLVTARCPSWPRLRPMIVAASIDADAATLCHSLGITCQTPPFAPLAPA